MITIDLYHLLWVLACIPLAEARSSMAFQTALKPATFAVSGIRTTNRAFKQGKTPDQIALTFVQQQLGLAAADVVVKSIVPTRATGVTSVYLRQKVNGIEVNNANINVNVNKYVVTSLFFHLDCQTLNHYLIVN